MRSSERWIVYPGLLVLGSFTFARQETRTAAPDAEFGDLKVRSLVVTGPEGKGRVGITVDSKGVCALALIPPDGGDVLALIARPGSGSALILSGEDKKLRVSLGTDAQGWPSLRMLDRENHDRIRLGLSSWNPFEGWGDAESWPSLLMLDRNDNPRVDLGLSQGIDLRAMMEADDRGEKPSSIPSVPGGQASLTLNGPPEQGLVGKVKATLTSDRTGTSLFLEGPLPYDTKPHLKLAANSEGPALSLSVGLRTRTVLGSTSLETIKTGAVEQTAPSSLVLFDKEGKVIFKAP